MKLAALRTIEDVQGLLSKELARPIPIPLLEEINREKQLVDAVLQRHDRATFKDLVSEVKYVLRVSTKMHSDLGPKRKYGQGPVPKSHDEARISTDRQRVLSLLVAKGVVESYSDVKRFRMGYLAKSILEPRLVEKWIRAHCSDNTAPELEVFASLELYFPHPPDQPYCRPYTYWDSAPYYSSIPWWIRADKLGGTRSVLGKLAHVAENVSFISGWSFGEAVWFTLTDENPELPLIRVFSNLAREDGMTGATIVLEVDPEAAPSVVADAYRKRRNELRSSRRSRPLSAKMLAFVQFVIAHRGVKLMSPTKWNPLIAEWNGLDYVRENRWQFGRQARRSISYDFNQALLSLEPQVEDYDERVVSSRLRESSDKDNVAASRMPVNLVDQMGSGSSS